jgi:adhesin transport system membrane fusion protein
VADGKPFVIPDRMLKDHPELVSHEKNLYASQVNQIKQLMDSQQYAAKELTMLKPLVAKGSASQVEVLRLQREASDLQEQVLKFKSEVLNELNTAKGELSALQASVQADVDRVARTTIVSPVKGIVQEIKVKTIGGVGQPGMELMNIVPLEDTLLVEAKINPKDIGFLHPNQKALVKITAFDYSIYGGFQGKVERISADSITEEKTNKVYYKVYVRTEKNYLMLGNKRLYIIPGMTATVDIITGKKTVLQYILKPILKAKEQALGER